ncbi:MAG: hypothetical protein PHC96_07235 [Firmicutes bacterium]|nr:hypothetical protein [Bacillota bacterium]
MKHKFTVLLILILVLSLYSTAQDNVNLASVVEGGTVITSEPLKDTIALHTILDGVSGTGGVVFTFGPEQKARILVELGGKSLNRIDEVVVTAKVPMWRDGQAFEIKVQTAEKAEGPFLDAGTLRLAYSGALGNVFEPRLAKYVLLELSTNSPVVENIIVEEVEIYGTAVEIAEPEPLRTMQQEKMKLFEHLGLVANWDLTDISIIDPAPHTILDGYANIEAKTSDILVRFNVDGRLESRANLAGSVTTPQNWERLFLPETVSVRCYYLHNEKAWLVGSQTVILDELNNLVELTLSLGANRSWPQGEYKIEFYVGENLPLSYYFSIEEARINADSTLDGAEQSE